MTIPFIKEGSYLKKTVSSRKVINDMRITDVSDSWFST